MGLFCVIRMTAAVFSLQLMGFLKTEMRKTTNRTRRVMIFTFRLYYSISFKLNCTVRMNKFKK